MTSRKQWKVFWIQGKEENMRLEVRDNHTRRGLLGADRHSLCTGAAMGPVRDLGSSMCTAKVAGVPPMETRHVTKARQSMRSSVGAEGIHHYFKLNGGFGSFKCA